MSLFHAAERLIFSTLLCAAVASAADWTLIRRLAQVSACVASTADALSTIRVMNAGGVETNPMLRTSSGQLSYGRMITIKAVSCVAPIVLSEYVLHRKGDVRAEPGGTAGAGVGIAFYSWATFHNLGVEQEMRRRQSVALLSNGVTP